MRKAVHLLLAFMAAHAAVAQPWEDILDGPIGSVYSTATDNNHLIATDHVYGREFPYAVHRYDGNAWENISDSTIAFGNPIRALCLFQGVPYCYHYHPLDGEGVFRYEIGSWNLIGAMTTGQVWGMKVYDDTLYIYGQFRDVNGDTSLRHIVKYDGEQFHPVAAPLSYRPEVGLGPIVKDIHFYQGSLYAVGSIRTASGQFGICRWDGTMWHDVGAGFPYGSNPNMLIEFDGYLLVNRHPDGYSGVAMGLSAWDGEHFLSLGDGINPYEAAVYSMAVHAGKLYVTGSRANQLGQWGSYFASWNGERWCGYEFPETADHMASFQGHMYAYLLRYTQPGNQPVHRFGRWMEETEADSCGEVVNVGIPENGGEGKAVSVYPNPTTGPLTITSAKPLLTVAVVDMLGRVLLSERGEFSNAKAIDLTHLPAGIYVVHVETEAGRWAQRVVRE